MLNWGYWRIDGSKSTSSSFDGYHDDAHEDDDHQERLLLLENLIINTHAVAERAVHPVRRAY